MPTGDNDFPPGPLGAALGSSGRIVTGVNANATERAGLGDIPTRWPDLRIIGSPRVSIRPDHSVAQVAFKIPWSQHQRLCAELVGWPFLTAVGPRRNIPEKYRLWMWQLVENVGIDSPPTPVMFCTAAEPIGFGLDTSYVTQNPARVGLNYYPDPNFEFAQVNATFETLAYDLKTLDQILEVPGMPAERQRYVIRTEDSGGRFLSFATGQVVLTNPPNVTINNPNFKSFQFWEPYQTITYEWFDVLPEAMNHQRNQTYCGCTNDSIFDVDKQPGTMLLLKSDRKPKLTQLGQRCYYVRHEFLYAPTGVNKAQPPGPDGYMYDPATNTYTPIYWNVVVKTTENNAVGMPPYRPKPMDNLFKP